MGTLPRRFIPHYHFLIPLSGRPTASKKNEASGWPARVLPVDLAANPNSRAAAAATAEHGVLGGRGACSHSMASTTAALSCFSDTAQGQDSSTEHQSLLEKYGCQARLFSTANFSHIIAQILKLNHQLEYPQKYCTLSLNRWTIYTTKTS